MRPQSAKAKGRRFQQWIRSLMLGFADSLLEEDDVRSTSMGAGGEDLLLSPLAQQVFPITPECKNQEALSIWKAMEQAEAHALDTGRTPVLFFKRNHSSSYAALPAAALIRLYVDLYNARNNAPR